MPPPPPPPAATGEYSPAYAPSPEGDGSRVKLLPGEIDVTAGDDQCCCRARCCRWRVQTAVPLFMAINFLTYYDRGAIAGALSQIKEDDSIGPLSDSHAGLLVSMFMVGFMVFSPIFASLGGTFRPVRIVAFGIFCWCLACLLSAIAWSYPVLVVARCLVGVGEAAYAGFIPPMIDDLAPAEKRTLYIGMYFAMIPFGQAAGMGCGGVVAGTEGFGYFEGWQVAFLTEIFPMLPLFLLLLFWAPVDAGMPRSDADPDNSRLSRKVVSTRVRGRDSPPPASPTWSNPSTSVLNDDPPEYPTPCSAFRAMVCNPQYVLTVLGYGVYTFVLGGLAAWGIDFLIEGPLEMNSSEAAVMFGGVTAVTGLGGTALGGMFVDRIGGSKGAKGRFSCHRFNTMMVVISLPCGLAAFFSRDKALFFSLCFLAELSLFATTSPANCAIMECVPTEMRTYAMAFSTFVVHAVGDFPSPLLIGVLSDHFSHGCRAYDEADGGTREICEGHGCRWIDNTPDVKQGDAGGAGDDKDSVCVYNTQLRDAVCIVYAALSVGVLLWGAAAVHAWRQAKWERRQESLRETVN